MYKIQILKPRTLQSRQWLAALSLNFCHSDFEFVSDFDIRISSLQY